MESTTSDVFKEPFRMSFTDTVYSNDTLLYHSHMIYVVTHLKEVKKQNTGDYFHIIFDPGGIL